MANKQITRKSQICV